MWAYGHHYRVERVDNKRRTYDCGIMANFQQESRSSARDPNVVSDDLDYVGTLQHIYEVDYETNGKYFIFDVKWFKVIYRGSNATIRNDNSKFFQIDSTKCISMDSHDTLVLPRHCEQVRL